MTWSLTHNATGRPGTPTRPGRAHATAFAKPGRAPQANAGYRNRIQGARLMRWSRNAPRHFRSGRWRTARDNRRPDHHNAGLPWTESVRFLRNRVHVRRNQTDTIGYAALERALRDLGMDLLLQLTADLVPAVLQRILASRQRPVDRDLLPPVSYLCRRPGGPMRA